LKNIVRYALPSITKTTHNERFERFKQFASSYAKLVAVIQMMPRNLHQVAIMADPNYNYYNHFTALWILSGTTWVSWHQKGKTRKVKPIWISWSKK